MRITFPPQLWLLFTWVWISPSSNRKSAIKYKAEIQTQSGASAPSLTQPLWRFEVAEQAERSTPVPVQHEGPLQVASGSVPEHHCQTLQFLDMQTRARGHTQQVKRKSAFAQWLDPLLFKHFFRCLSVIRAAQVAPVAREERKSQKVKEKR